MCVERHYIDFDGNCKSCADESGLNVASIIFIVVAVLLILLGGWIWRRIKLSWKLRTITVGKIMLAYYQILSVTQTAFSFDWPPLFKQVLQWLSRFGLDLNLSILQCAASFNHYGHLLLNTLSPVALAGAGVALLRIHKEFRS